MLESPITKENIAALQARGGIFLFPETNVPPLTIGGGGLIAEPWQIFCEASKALSDHDYEGKHVLITTGSSREYLDPVRYFGRRSSGKMGIALAREAHRRGARVTLIHGPIPTLVPSSIECRRVITTTDMHQNVMEFVNSEDRPDIVVMAAALADYAPVTTSQGKLEFSGEKIELSLSRNTDVLSSLVASRKEGVASPLLVGFSEASVLEDDPVESLREKLAEKKVDVLIGTVTEERLEGENHYWVLDKQGHQTEVVSMYKSRVANRMLSAISKLF